MWFLALLIVLNAVLNNSEFVNTYRVYVGAIPLNVFDFMILGGLLVAFLWPQISGRQYPVDRAHPAMKWLLILFALGFIGGLIGAPIHGSTTRQILTSARNYMAAPAALYLGYALTLNFKSVRLFNYAMVIAGLGASFMVIVFFREQSEVAAPQRDVTSIRAVAYISLYAGIAAAFLTYTLAAKLRLFPVALSVLALVACVIGQFGTLSRSDWIACLAAIIAAFVVLPKGTRLPSFLRSLLVVPLIAMALWVGMYGASKATGKDVFAKMYDRVLSLLPGDRAGHSKKKAWETRLPGTFRELRMFASSPIFGGGFAIQDSPDMEPMVYEGMRHNSWTATLAETGILGFSAFALMAGATIVAGWRLIRDQLDKTTVLAGAVGVVTGAYCIVHGLTTMSFNQVRSGLPLFITAGVILRVRAMQLTELRLRAEERAMLEQNPELLYEGAFQPDASGAAYVDEPVFGNWY